MPDLPRAYTEVRFAPRKRTLGAFIAVFLLGAFGAFALLAVLATVWGGGR